MPLHRARDVAQHDERARAAGRGAARPTPTRSPPVARLSPEHRPRRQAPAVRVELVAACQAGRQPRPQQVDEPLGVAQLAPRHPVELAVADGLPRRCTHGAPRATRRHRPAAPRPRRLPGAVDPAAGVGRPGPPGRPRAARRPPRRRHRPAADPASPSAGMARSVPRAAARTRRRRRRTGRDRRGAGRRWLPRRRAPESRSPMSTSVSARAKSSAPPRSVGTPAERRARVKQDGVAQEDPAVERLDGVARRERGCRSSRSSRRGRRRTLAATARPT